MKFAGVTREEWRQRGHDVYSQVADPLFVAADQYDFRLKEESPALDMGFRPIDVTAVGVRPKGKR